MVKWTLCAHRHTLTQTDTHLFLSIMPVSFHPSSFISLFLSMTPSVSHSINLLLLPSIVFHFLCLSLSVSLSVFSYLSLHSCPQCHSAFTGECTCVELPLSSLFSLSLYLSLITSFSLSQPLFLSISLYFSLSFSLDLSIPIQTCPHLCQPVGIP